MQGEVPGEGANHACRFTILGTVRAMTQIGDASHPNLVREPRTRTKASRRRDAWTAPVLDSRPGGAAERFAHALGLRHPAVICFTALLGGILLLAGIRSADNGFVRDLAQNRTGFETDASWVGSMVGGAPVLPILVGLIGLAFAIARRWRIAAFAVFVLVAESATYRLTTLAIHRPRPGVHRLEDLPVNASYPSGHTAASIAVYSGLVLLLTSRLTSSTSRALAWTFAILMATYVAFSRMYRGMHHPLDVAGGVVVGIGAILLLLFACRAAGAAAEARAAAKARS